MSGHRAAGPEPVTIAESAADVLFDVVLHPYVDRCLDLQHGGYLVDFDAQGQPNGPHRKTLEHAGRTTLAFALLNRALPQSGFAQHVEHGLRFLRDRMWDHDHGGFYALVDREGTPLWNGLKHPHGVTYAVRAIVLGSEVLGETESTRWVSDALKWLDGVCWDTKYDGYRGTFRRDNSPYLDGESVPTDFGDDPLGLRVGMLEFNTQGDVVHTLVDALVLGGLEVARPRLETLTNRTLQVVQPNGVLPFLLLPDWTPTPTPSRTGHQFQLVRRIVAAGEAIGRQEETHDAALRLALHGLRLGRHPDGGYPLEMSSNGRMWSTDGSMADSRQWWVQLEALDAFAFLAAHPATPTSIADELTVAASHQWEFFERCFVDRVHGGIYEYPRSSSLPATPAAHAANHRTLRGRLGIRRPEVPAAEPLSAAKHHGWKDISHEVAVLLDLAAGSDRLAGGFRSS